VTLGIRCLRRTSIVSSYETRATSEFKDFPFRTGSEPVQLWLNPDRNERHLSIITQRYSHAVQIRRCCEIPKIAFEIGHVPSSRRHTFPDRDQKGLVRSKVVFQVGSLLRVRRFPLARVCLFRESEREFRNASYYARRSRSSR